MSTEPLATPTVASAWYHSICTRCQRSVELAIAVEGIGTLCPGCCNILDEEPTMTEVCEDD